jgi:hypothetical protein
MRMAEFAGFKTLLQISSWIRIDIKLLNCVYIGDVTCDNAGIIADNLLTLANINAQGGQGKYNSVSVAGVIALNSTPM